MIGMMVGHPHLQISNVGMCVYSYNLCVCVKQDNEKFLGRIQLRNASKVTFEKSVAIGKF
jgi:hypothetical protein